MSCSPTAWRSSSPPPRSAELTSMNSLLRLIPIRPLVLALAVGAGIARADVVPASL